MEAVGCGKLRKWGLFSNFALFMLAKVGVCSGAVRQVAVMMIMKEPLWLGKKEVMLTAAGFLNNADLKKLRSI